MVKDAVGLVVLILSSQKLFFFPTKMKNINMIDNCMASENTELLTMFMCVFIGCVVTLMKPF